MKYNCTLGDKISKSSHFLHKGDVKNLLKDMKKDSVKLLITSPPYNIGKEYEKKINFEDYLDQQIEVIDELIDVVRDDGSICWQVGNYIKSKGEIIPLDIPFYNIFINKGLKLRNRIVWHYGHGLHANKRLSGRYETILWFTKSDDYTFNLDDIRIPQKYPGKRYPKGHKRAGEVSGNPKGKNQHELRSNKELQKIIDKYPLYTKKDFRGEGKLNPKKHYHQSWAEGVDNTRNAFYYGPPLDGSAFKNYKIYDSS